jgi:hypothetical protein
MSVERAYLMIEDRPGPLYCVEDPCGGLTGVDPQLADAVGVVKPSL